MPAPGVAHRACRRESLGYAIGDAARRRRTRCGAGTRRTSSSSAGSSRRTSSSTRVIVVASIFGDRDFLGVTVLWSIYIAFKYAKLWSDGYDWRDVFRQPRERELIDVVDEFTRRTCARCSTATSARRMRERNRARNCRARARPAPTSCGMLERRRRPARRRRSALAGTARRTRAPRRDAIATRSCASSSTLPDRERARVADVAPLGERARTSASSRSPIALADLERNVVSGGGAERSRPRSSRSRTRRIRSRARQRGARAPARVPQAPAPRGDGRAGPPRRGRGEARDLRRSRSQNIKLDLMRLQRRLADAPAHHVARARGDGDSPKTSTARCIVADEVARATGTRPVARASAVRASPGDRLPPRPRSSSRSAITT